MKERLFFIAVLFALIISAFVSIYFFPSYLTIYEGEQFFSLGGISSFFEGSLGAFFPYFIKIVTAISLLFFARKSLALAFVSFVLVFIMPQNAESLLFPLVLCASIAPLWAVVLSSLMIGFVSKLALPAIVLSFIMRIVIKGPKNGSFYPLFGIFSPPFLVSLFKGDLFSPFLLSASSFPPFSPISLFSPIFWFFSISLIVLLFDEGNSFLKILSAAISYLFNPLSSILFISLLFNKENFKKGMAFLFAVPFLVFIVFPPLTPAIPKGVEKILEKIEKKDYSIVTAPELYYQTKSKFSKRGCTLKPKENFSELLTYYKTLPLMPPLIGYEVLEGDLVLLRANYPQNQNLRQYKKGYFLLWCGKEYALFAKESFLRENPKIKPLNNYSPYLVMPQDIEQRKAALAEIDEILKDEPLFFEGWRDKGRILLDFKEPQKAVESFEAALKVKKSAQVYNDLGVAYTNLEKYDEALNSYLESMKLSPRDLYPRMNYAYAAMTSGKFEDALFVLEDLNRAYPTFYPAYRLHYQIYGRMGEIEKAKEILRKIPKEMRTQDENDLLGEK